MLPPSKVIGNIRYFTSNDGYIIFMVNKINEKRKATFEDTNLALINLKQFCEENNINKLVMEKIGP